MFAAELFFLWQTVETLLYLGPPFKSLPYTEEFMWQIKSVFKKIKTGIRNGQGQYYSDFI